MPVPSTKFASWSAGFGDRFSVACLADVREIAFAYVLGAVRRLVGEAISGPEKKQALLDGLAALVDRLIAAVPFPTWLIWAKPAVAWWVRGEIVAVADRLIEAALTDQRQG